MRKVLFILFLLTIVCALGLLVLQKLRHEIAIDRCMDQGGTWNYMEQDCDRQRSKN
jgi:hypothetical protein